jgi:uncharacterized membrane protein
VKRTHPLRVKQRRCVVSPVVADVGTTGHTTEQVFSNRVFALATPLLVLAIHVPASGVRPPLAAIAQMWPAYLGYVTSCVTIDGIWLARSF